MNLSIGQLAEIVDGVIERGSGVIGPLTGFADLSTATPSDISFFSNKTYARQLKSTQAGVVLVAKDYSDSVEGPWLLKVDNPSLAFAEVVKRFGLPEAKFCAGIHPRAIIHPLAKLDPEQVCIHPGAVVGNATIGEGTEIGANVVIGDGVQIGRDCKIHPNVTIRENCILGNGVILQPGVVIGGDGFGYEFSQGKHQRVPQIGIVQLDDDVEIGANSTVDRARFGRTWIQEGTKIDNLVQVGHNVLIGKHVILVALTGVAGSSKIGDYTVAAAQVGVAGHLEIGPKSTLAARAGVTKSLGGGQIYAGYPAQPMDKARRAMVLDRTVERLRKRLGELEKKLHREKDC